MVCLLARDRPHESSSERSERIDCLTRHKQLHAHNPSYICKFIFPSDPIVLRSGHFFFSLPHRHLTKMFHLIRELAVFFYVRNGFGDEMRSMPPDNILFDRRELELKRRYF